MLRVNLRFVDLKFQSCSLCRESLRRERVAKIPYLPLVLDVALVQQQFVTQSL